ncbi:MAG: hypothetical protein JWP88_207 [Flaviaesturariibacter sp.]|nr:hypothetical protein [Flaviaesturariibacter sp.]
MRKIFLYLFLSLPFGFCQAQMVRTPVGSVYTRLSAYTPRFADAFSMGANQGVLADLQTFSAGVSGERRFMLQDLPLYLAAVALPTNRGNFGFSASYSGSTTYNESAMGLAYARKLGAKVSLGVQFNYQSITVQGYGSTSAVNAEAGALFHATDKLHLGVHAYNPTSVRLGKGEERLPAIFTSGAGYEVSDHFFASAEVQKTEGQPLSVNAGMQYGFGRQAFARGGFSSANESFYLGIGLLLKGFRLDATASVHPQLGVTPGIMLLYNRSAK